MMMRNLFILVRLEDERAGNGLFLVHQTEISDKANEEGMRTVVYLDIIHMALPDVAKITRTEHYILTQSDVERNLLPKAKSICWLGKTHVMI